MGNEDGKKVRVRIAKSSGNGFWYDTEIGNIFIVKEWINNSYITDKFWTIRAEDCEVVSDQNMTLSDYVKCDECGKEILRGINCKNPVTGKCDIPLFLQKEPTSDAPKVEPKVSLDLTKVNISEKELENTWKMTQRYLHPDWSEAKIDAHLISEKIRINGKKEERTAFKYKGVNYNFNHAELVEFCKKLDKPTESPRSERIEISIDGNTYYINRKAWELEQQFRKLRNQLYERQISQKEYDQILEQLIP